METFGDFDRITGNVSAMRSAGFQGTLVSV